MLAVSFALFAAVEWKLSKNKASGSKAFWCIFSVFLLWNLGANLMPGWPNLNRLVMSVLGWIIQS
ncbi:hypothetical protein ACTHPF_00525 [Paenibacillus sp. SAF-054]|uniref:hypothetical protein n=1 Tax=unclassified Paenibacillus TaxID=185978 RepID=UPI003F7EC781